MLEGRSCLLNKLNKQENYYLIKDTDFVLLHKSDGTGGSGGGSSMCVEEIN